MHLGHLSRWPFAFLGECYTESTALGIDSGGMDGGSEKLKNCRTRILGGQAHSYFTMLTVTSLSSRLNAPGVKKPITGTININPPIKSATPVPLRE